MGVGEGDDCLGTFPNKSEALLEFNRMRFD